MIYFDNTRISAFRNCPRYFYLRHIRNWTRPGTSPALAFGSSWHSAMDQVWEFAASDVSDSNLLDLSITSWESTMIKEGVDIHDPSYGLSEMRTMGTAKEMIKSYIMKNRRFISEVEVLAIEQPFAVPIDLPNEEKESIFYIGRRDKDFKHKGRINTAEHKTTSSYKKGGPFRDNWVSSFSPDSQIDGYTYAGYLQYGEVFKGIWVDAALVHKTVHDGFMFIPIERSFNNLDSWLWETQYWIKSIRYNLKALEIITSSQEKSPTHLQTFPKNTTYCKTYAGCMFTDICKIWSNPSLYQCPKTWAGGRGFIEKKWQPFDELKIAQLGLKEED